MRRGGVHILADSFLRAMGKSTKMKATGSQTRNGSTQRKITQATSVLAMKCAKPSKSTNGGAKKAVTAVAVKKAMKAARGKKAEDLVVAENIHVTQRERLVFAACLGLCNEGRLFEGMTFPVQI